MPRRSFPKAEIGNGAQHFCGAVTAMRDKDETALVVLVLVVGVAC